MTADLKRSLGPVSAVCIIVGGVIGSGIFFMPWHVAGALAAPWVIHACWIGLGLVCLCGASAYAELGVLFPEAGGQYAFLREGFGRCVAFLYGWTLFLVINTGTFAALAVAFAASVGSVWTLPGPGEPALACAMILALAITNHYGVGVGAILQNALTLLKVAALAALTLAGFLAEPPLAPPPGAATQEWPALGVGLASAALAIFWAYEGWHQLPFSAAELKEPRRDLPRGLWYGTLALIGVYAVVNAAYLHAIPVPEMAGLARDVDVPRLTLERGFGIPLAMPLALVLAASCVGAANPCLLSTPRAFYAMAKDGLAVAPLMRVHPRWRTPTVAIWTQALWALAIVLIGGRLRNITDFVIFGALLFYALAVASVYVLRRRLPDRPRPYRCLGYPVTPALFILVVVAVDVLTLFDATSRSNALYGLAILGAGLPVYAVLRRRAPRAAVT